MPEKKTLEQARRDKREGKAASTQAGEFVREEIHHVRKGKHGVKNAKQAIAIGLSKARRAGVALPRKKGVRAEGKKSGRPSTKRSRAATEALRRQPRRGASRRSLGRQVKKAARKR